MNLRNIVVSLVVVLGPVALMPIAAPAATKTRPCPNAHSWVEGGTAATTCTVRHPLRFGVKGRSNASWLTVWASIDDCGPYLPTIAKPYHVRVTRGRYVWRSPRVFNDVLHAARKCTLTIEVTLPNRPNLRQHGDMFIVKRVHHKTTHAASS